MKILLATNNKGKVKELKAFFENYEVFALEEILNKFEVEENGSTFQENALIKARAIYEKLSEKDKEEFIVLSDDSGLSVELLKQEPGIYSARYSQAGTDSENRKKVIEKLKEQGKKESPAYFTACLALVSKIGEATVHGFMQGKVIDEERGENGFGYDALFIPKNYSLTLGELPKEEKAKISHRSQALKLSEYILSSSSYKKSFS